MLHIPWTPWAYFAIIDPRCLKPPPILLIGTTFNRNQAEIGTGARKMFVGEEQDRIPTMHSSWPPYLTWPSVAMSGIDNSHNGILKCDVFITCV